jgi:CRISPR-associated protein Cmr2
MTQYLLQIHIGPMQAFIAAARRTRDLWFGSWLMSELSKAAARGVAEQAGEENLIFPAAPLTDLRPETDLAVANKIVAIVADPKTVAELAEKAVRQRLDDLTKVALSEVKGALQTREIVEAQIRDLLEFYWVAVPLPSPNKYKDVRAQAEILLAARKSCRQFAQPEWGGNRPKSSLDGNRESVIPESTYPSQADSPEKRQEKIKLLFTNYHARNAERLSGVDLLKRLGKSRKQQSFPSTSHISSMPVRQRLREGNDEVKQAWQAYIEALREVAEDLVESEQVSKEVAGEPHAVFGYADGSLLFESRLTEYFGNAIPDEVQRAFKGFFKTAGIGPVSPYYTLLMGDGDGIGAMISKLEEPSEHRQFSQTLARFAGKAQKIITDHQGAAVYTGGDDVLALLPLHTALQCAAELAAAFRQMMKTEGYEVTFSVGIAIGHHLEPLEDALELVRKAEKEAKSVPGKNALAIIEAKRSGAERMIKGQWGQLDSRLLTLTTFYQREQLPHGLAYQLRDMALHLGGEMEAAGDDNLRQVLKVEAARIIKRKEDSVAAAQEMIIGMVGQLDEKYTMTRLVNELIIANTLAKAAEESGKEISWPEQQEVL